MNSKTVPSKRGRKRRSDELDLLRKSAKLVKNDETKKSKPKTKDAQGKKEGTRRKGRRRQSTGSEDDDEDLCAATGCLKPSGENVDWVQCDGGCDKWFHMACVGLSAQDICEDEDYICAACSENTYGSLNSMESISSVSSDCSTLTQPSTSKDSVQCKI